MDASDKMSASLEEDMVADEAVIDLDSLEAQLEAEIAEGMQEFASVESQKYRLITDKLCRSQCFIHTAQANSN